MGENIILGSNIGRRDFGLRRKCKRFLIHDNPSRSLGLFVIAHIEIYPRLKHLDGIIIELKRPITFIRNIIVGRSDRTGYYRIVLQLAFRYFQIGQNFCQNSLHRGKGCYFLTVFRYIGNGFFGRPGCIGFPETTQQVEMHLGTQTVSLSSYQMIIPSGKHSRIGLVDIGYQFVDIGNQVITVFPNGIDTCLARRSVIIVYHFMSISVIIARNAGIVLGQYIEQTECEFFTIQRRRSHRQITTGEGIFKSLLGTKIIFGFYFGFRTHVEPIITSCQRDKYNCQSDFCNISFHRFFCF